MIKIDITEENRDLYYHKNKHLWFEKESDNLYTIHTDLDYILEHCGINFTNDDNDYCDMTFTDINGIVHKCHIISFDPVGGPYICINHYKINGEVVKKIFFKDSKYYFSTK